MTPRYTPGPWHVGMRSGPIVYGPLGEQIADCRSASVDGTTAGYNARLIAETTAMLAEIRQLLVSARYADGQATVLTQDMEALEAIVARIDG